MKEFEIIKNHFDKWQDNFGLNAYDIEFLISRLEIAEKALMVFADDENWFLDDRSSLPIEFNVNTSNDPGEIAKEAIRKIREGG